MQREFRGIWIPAALWLDETLSITEKVMLVEIDSLDSSERGCYASNSHFAKFFGLSPSRVSEIINSLARRGLISVELIRSGRQVIERRVRITGVFGKPNTYSENTENPIRKTEGGYSEKAKGRDTSMSNTSEKKHTDDAGAPSVPAADAPAAPSPKKAAKFDGRSSLIDLGVEEQVADDWLAIRKAKKLPLTATALEGVKREAGKAGVPVAKALRICCERGWGGFKAEWLADKLPTTPIKMPRAVPAFDPFDETTWGINAKGVFDSGLYIEHKRQAFLAKNGGAGAGAEIDMGVVEVVE